MQIIIYSKANLMCVGVVQKEYPTMIENPFAWEIENNVIPNFGGTESDYSTIETDLTRFHLENVNGEVVAVEDIILPAIEEIRNQRNQLLSQCDWTQVLDSPLTEENLNAWATYRQALRDFPGTVDLTNIEWPTQPQ